MLGRPRASTSSCPGPGRPSDGQITSRRDAAPQPPPKNKIKPSEPCGQKAAYGSSTVRMFSKGRGTRAELISLGHDDEGTLARCVGAAKSRPRGSKKQGRYVEFGNRSLQNLCQFRCTRGMTVRGVPAASS